MAEIQIFCTHCEYRFTVSAGLAGTTMNCPHCKKDFTVMAPHIQPMERSTNRPAAIASVTVLVLMLILLILAASGGRKENDTLFPAEENPLPSAAVTEVQNQ
jgi:uncharacterized paraquat-inducible protein A